MNWKARTTTVCLFASFWILFHTPFAQAWDSAIHQGVVRLLDLKKLDVKLKGLQSAVLDGADEPDRKKPFKPLDHYSQARSRATRAFDSAVIRYCEGVDFEETGKTKEAEAKYQEAASGLGNSFHYIEDLAAVEKTVDEPGILPGIGPKEHKSIVRDLAKALMEEIGKDPASLEGFQKSALKYRETTFRKFDDVDQMLIYGQSLLGSYSEMARGVFKKTLEEGWTSDKRDNELKPIIRLNLLLTVAAMDRVIEIFNYKVKGYYCIFQITFPAVKEDLKPKKVKGESTESWKRRRKAAYESLTYNDFTFGELPVDKSPLIIHVYRDALAKYPAKDLSKDSQWNIKVESKFKKDGESVTLDGVILLTARGIYESMEQLLEVHQALKGVKGLKTVNFKEESGTAKGVEANNTYVAGPLKNGWSEEDRRESVKFMKSLLLLYDCFIAHAVYDDLDTPQVNLFRKFRDRVLKNSEAGRRLILLYCEYGPEYAMRLRRSPGAIPYLRCAFDGLAMLLGKLENEQPSVKNRWDRVVFWTERTASIFWKEGRSRGLGQWTRLLVPVLWDETGSDEGR